MRKFQFWLICILITIVASGCSLKNHKSLNNNNSTGQKIKDQNEAREVFTIYQLHNSDAKFYGNKIMTNTDKGLVFYDLKGNKVKEYSSVKANWIDSIKDDGIVIYSNINKETGICIFDKNLNLLENNIVLKTEALAIDPSILKVNNEYYITLTTIVGNINNGKPDKENGEYSVSLYHSLDLQHFEFVNTILKEKNNIEDVELKMVNDKLALIYEKENLDKGLSSINIIMANDKYGKESWNKKIELLTADSDHEPASFIKKDDNYFLYYSSDKDSVGESYNKAKVYYTSFDSNFHKINEVQVNLEHNIGNLLYDVMLINHKRYFLFAQDYLSKCNLAVEYQKEY